MRTGQRAPHEATLRLRSKSAGRLKRGLRIFLAFLFAMPSAAEPVSQQRIEPSFEMVAAEFLALAKEYIDDLHARHPLLASFSGIHTWDDKLEDFSASAIAAEASSIRRFQGRLQRIQPLTLALSDLFDFQIIASNINSRLLELEQVRTHERNPYLYESILSTSLLQLTLFESETPEIRLGHVIAKENKIPHFLETARANVHKPHPVLLRIAIENFTATLKFVRDDLPRAFASVKLAALQAQLEKSTRTATDAIANHLKDLQKIKPEPDASFAIGKQSYEARLRYEEGIDIPVAKLLSIANRELARSQDLFRQTAARIDPRRAAMEVWADIQRSHPKAGTLVEEARKQTATLAQFIRDRGIVTLPVAEQVVVSESPDFMRWSSASMWTPGPFEKMSLPARYMITDVDPKWSENQKEEYLGSINYPQLWTTSIHEGYPGHFVQGEYLKRVDSVVRKTAAFSSGTLVEGWAHYAEQMMLDEGFGDNDPKLRLGQVADALLRLCRFVVGIRMHTEGLTVEQGKIFFMQNAFLGETRSRIEAERGTFDPLYLVYSVGKLAILKLREDYRRYRGSEFSLQEFHDRLLSNGNAPIWVQRQMLMPGDKGKLLE